MEEYLDQLNESQREAVKYNEGPSLVIAGAGSGKTRVLTYKIAYLVHLGLAPQSILALTFTNKAAREMKERFERLTAGKNYPVTFGTFHSIFYGILKCAYGIGANNLMSEKESSVLLQEVLDQTDIESTPEVEDEEELVRELLREVGACFSVNNMLRAECYKQRMEKGLSFLEFNYMIMQSYDFYYLFQHYGCNMQFGGDDQWSNMLGGTELIRRKLGKDAHAMTITLLLNSEGKKMGKTQSGAVWLDPNKTSPYDFYQYWRNVGDADVLKCIRMLTFLPLEQIDEMDTWQGSQLNTAKEILAFELTKLVHGEEEAAKAQEAARALFGGGGDSANMPCTKLCREDFTAEGEIDILTLLVKCGLAASKGEARRLVQQGGVTVCGQKVADIEARFSCKDCCGEGAVIKKGKKVYHKAVLEEQ